MSFLDEHKFRKHDNFPDSPDATRIYARKKPKSLDTNWSTTRDFGAKKKKHFSFSFFFVAIAKLVIQTSVKVLGRKGIIGTFKSQHSARKKSRL